MKEHFNFVASSANKKLGPMPTSYGPRSTCPDTCPLKGTGGCYAGFGHVSLIWNRVSRGGSGLPWKGFCGQVQALERGRIWRYATAGDLPGKGNVIDKDKLAQLADANRGKLGYAGVCLHPQTGCSVSGQGIGGCGCVGGESESYSKGLQQWFHDQYLG